MTESFTVVIASSTISISPSIEYYLNYPTAHCSTHDNLCFLCRNRKISYKIQLNSLVSNSRDLWHHFSWHIMHSDRKWIRRHLCICYTLGQIDITSPPHTQTQTQCGRGGAVTYSSTKYRIYVVLHSQGSIVQARWRLGQSKS